MSQKRTFQMASCAQKRRSVEIIPKASDIKKKETYFEDLSKEIIDQIGSPKLVIGIDIETHGWPEHSSKKGHIGKFRFYTMKDDAAIEYGRIIQIAWVVGECRRDSDTISKCSLVQPEGFQIEWKATNFHGISNEMATASGAKLKDVLNEFMKDVMTAYDDGGIIVAHQIEFDAGVIYSELGRCGLNDLQTKWMTMVRKGFCTMSPSLGRWLLKCNGEDIGATTVQHALGLNKVAKLILPEHDEIKHHDAECDAKLCRMTFVALVVCMSGKNETKQE